MKKQILAMVLVIIMLFCVGCSQKEDPAAQTTSSNAEHLEGYYISHLPDESKYKFTITDIATGDYGGECTNMDNINVISAYHAVGNEIYVDGVLTYIYLDNYLAVVESEYTMHNTLSISDSGQIVGSYKMLCKLKGYSDSISKDYVFYEDGTVKECREINSHNPRTVFSTYTVQDNIVTVSSEDYEAKLFAIWGNAIYPLLERV